jgi:hypothetical protein
MLVVDPERVIYICQEIKIWMRKVENPIFIKVGWSLWRKQTYLC